MRWIKVQSNFFICYFQGEDPYPWPMFSSYPPPQCYTLDPPKIHDHSLGKTDARVAAGFKFIIVIFHLCFDPPCTDPEIGSFLESTKAVKNDESWMETCRRLYCKVMTTKPNVLTGNGTVQLAGVSVYVTGILTCSTFY